MRITFSGKLYKCLQRDEAYGGEIYSPPQYIFASSIESAVDIMNKLNLETGLQLSIENGKVVSNNSTCWTDCTIIDAPDHVGSCTFSDVTADLIAMIKRDFRDLSMEEHEVREEMMPAFMSNYQDLNIASRNRGTFIEDIEKILKTAVAGPELEVEHDQQITAGLSM